MSLTSIPGAYCPISLLNTLGNIPEADTITPHNENFHYKPEPARLGTDSYYDLVW